MKTVLVLRLHPELGQPYFLHKQIGGWPPFHQVSVFLGNNPYMVGVSEVFVHSDTTTPPVVDATTDTIYIRVWGEQYLATIKPWLIQQGWSEDPLPTCVAPKR
jgi:hypothetical protein